MQTRIEVRRYESLSEVARRAVAGMEGGETTIDPRLAGFRWAPAHWYVLLWVRAGASGEELASSIKIVERTATAGEERLRLGGIGDVATVPLWRRRGFASAALAEAGRFICEEMGVDFGLLFCDEALLSFYGRLGWQRVAGPTLVQVPWGRVPFPEETMVLPCRRHLWPEGTIDLDGLPW